MTLQLVVQNEAPRLPIIVRKSVSDAFKDAAAGKPLEQPHGIADSLITEGFIAQEKLRAMGAYLQKKYAGSFFEIGPDKDLKRAMDKKGDLQKVMDIVRGRMFVKPQDIPAIIRDFGQKHTLLSRSSSEAFNIVEVDNTFPKENPKKPGLRYLDVKLLIELDLADGIQTYHIGELQFIHEGMRKDWTKSHTYYQEARMQQRRKQFLEAAMEMVEKRSGTAFNRLRAEHAATIERYNAAMERRTEINTKSAGKNKVDAIMSGQICVSCNDDFVAKPLPGAYIVPVVN